MMEPFSISMVTIGFLYSAGSQFFIMVDKAPHLDGGYAAFGKIIEGMEKLRRKWLSEQGLRLGQLLDAHGVKAMLTLAAGYDSPFRNDVTGA